MSIVQIDDYARQLYSAHGDRAEYEAAQKAKDYAAKGDSETAEQWRQVREAIRVLARPQRQLTLPAPGEALRPRFPGAFLLPGSARTPPARTTPRHLAALRGESQSRSPSSVSTRQ